MSLERVLNFTIVKREDVVCQSRISLKYQGYDIDIRYLRFIEGFGFAVLIQFKSLAKWHHPFIDQNKRLLNDLMFICSKDICNLRFSKFTSTPRFGGAAFDYYHDSRALNRNYEFGYDISPLLIVPDSHDGKVFVEMQFNPACYRRVESRTELREDWKEHVGKISEAIREEAQGFPDRG